MSSMPATVMAADQSDWNPIIGRAIRLTARWSCSTILLGYFAYGPRPEASHSQFNAGLIVGVVIVDRCGVGAALIEGDLFRQTRLIDRFTKQS